MCHPPALLAPGWRGSHSQHRRTIVPRPPVPVAKGRFESCSLLVGGGGEKSRLMLGSQSSCDGEREVWGPPSAPPAFAEAGGRRSGRSQGLRSAGAWPWVCGCPGLPSLRGGGAAPGLRLTTRALVKRLLLTRAGLLAGPLP